MICSSHESEHECDDIHCNHHQHQMMNPENLLDYIGSKLMQRKLFLKSSDFGQILINSNSEVQCMYLVICLLVVTKS